MHLPISGLRIIIWQRYYFREDTPTWQVGKRRAGVHIMHGVAARLWVSFLLIWAVVAKSQVRNDLSLFYETQTHLSNPTMQNSTN